MKHLCAQQRILYDGRLVTKAVDAATFSAMRQRNSTSVDSQVDASWSPQMTADNRRGHGARATGTNSSDHGAQSTTKTELVLSVTDGVLTVENESRWTGRAGNRLDEEVPLSLEALSVPPDRAADSRLSAAMTRRGTVQ